MKNCKACGAANGNASKKCSACGATFGAGLHDVAADGPIDVGLRDDGGMTLLWTATGEYLRFTAAETEAIVRGLRNRKVPA